MIRIITTILLLSVLSGCHSSRSTGGEGGAARTASRAETADAAGSGAGEGSGQDAPYPYAAIITCSTSGMQVDVIACFSGSSDTNLELRNGDKYGLYQPMDIERLGQKTSEGMRIELARKFELTMQNASDSLILGVKIVNNIPSADFGKVLYEKSAGQFGVIKVDN